MGSAGARYCACPLAAADRETRRRVAIDRDDHPLVSVVIPARRLGPGLDATLRTIADQAYATVEIIVVTPDTASQPGSGPGGHVRFLHADGKSRSRNIGAAAAEGQWLFLVDDDMRIAPTCIAECLEVAAATGCSAIAVPERELGGGRGVFGRAVDLERQLASDDDAIV